MEKGGSETVVYSIVESVLIFEGIVPYLENKRTQPVLHSIIFDTMTEHCLIIVYFELPDFICYRSNNQKLRRRR